MHKAVTLTSENFKSLVLEAKGPVLVGFWAGWCGPCQAMVPVVETLAQELDGQAIVGKVDVDENRELARAYGVRSLPTFAVFRNGEVVDQHIGTASRSRLRELTLSQVAA
jgi:thioredoxin 1